MPIASEWNFLRGGGLSNERNVSQWSNESQRLESGAEAQGKIEWTLWLRALYRLRYTGKLWAKEYLRSFHLISIWNLICERDMYRWLIKIVLNRLQLASSSVSRYTAHHNTDSVLAGCDVDGDREREAANVRVKYKCV